MDKSSAIGEYRRFNDSIQKRGFITTPISIDIITKFAPLFLKNRRPSKVEIDNTIKPILQQIQNENSDCFGINYTDTKGHSFTGDFFNLIPTDNPNQVTVGATKIVIQRRRFICTFSSIPVTFTKHAVVRVFQRKEGMETVNYLPSVMFALLFSLHYNLITQESDGDFVLPFQNGLYLCKQSSEGNVLGNSSIYLDNNGLRDALINNNFVIHSGFATTFVDHLVLSERQEKIRDRMIDFFNDNYVEFLHVIKQILFFDDKSHRQLLEKQLSPYMVWISDLVLSEEWQRSIRPRRKSTCSIQ